MAFKKPKARQQRSESNVDWNAFNEHLAERVQEAIDENGTNMVCFVSMLIDSGTQPPQEPYREYNWEDSEQQNRLLDNPKVDCYVEGDKFYIANRPNDSIVIAVDFPSIMVDYGKFFNDGKSEERPYRHLIADEYQGVAGYTSYQPSSDGFSPLSAVSKIAKATGAFKGKGKVPSDFDIGDVLGLPFTMDIETNPTNKDGKIYANVKAKNPSAKHKAIPVPEHDIEPCVVFMNDDNDEEALKTIRYSVIKRLEMAQEWSDSKLKAQLEALGKLGNSSQSSQEDESEEEAPAPKKLATKKPVAKKPEPQEDESDEDDDNPFE